MTASEINKNPDEKYTAPPEGTVLVSIIIVCYNSCKWLSNCLASLQKQTYFQKSEVILVDNASKDGTEQLARELTANWSNARVIQTGDNLGFGVANNQGAEVSQGKYLYLLNPDTQGVAFDQIVLASQ